MEAIRARTAKGHACRVGAAVCVGASATAGCCGTTASEENGMPLTPSYSQPAPRPARAVSTFRLRACWLSTPGWLSAAGAVERRKLEVRLRSIIAY